MSYESVDALQRALTSNVFHYAKDSKKAAGRALGTLVEIITFYLLKSWGLEKNTAIERRLPEYGNPDITHNVEYTLHPSSKLAALTIPRKNLPITAKKILKLVDAVDLPTSSVKSTQLLSSAEILHNATTVCENDDSIIVSYLGQVEKHAYSVDVCRLKAHPFAIIECKRVGVEEGRKKGPQTIEKAKQGAYVARTVSSLQKVRMSDGKMYGVLETDNELCYLPYAQFLQEIVASDDPAMLRDFTLTVGVVSNHGNWFTSSNHNKELRVLAQSYDWLLFLTDRGLSEFVESLILDPSPPYKPIKKAFDESYSGKAGKNRFTKVQIALSADLALRKYFTDNLPAIEKWFNVISPAGQSIAELKQELSLLATKKWEDILV